MKISAVVATYNRERFLPEALEGLRIQTLSPECFEVIIVNNNSTDRTKEISFAFQQNNPQLKIIYCEEYNQGLSFGRNRGIEESSTPIVTFIDDDAVIEKHFLEKTVSYMEEYHEIDAVGGKIFAKFLNKKPEWLSKYIMALVGEVDYGDTIFEYEAGRYPFGSNMSIKTAMLNKVGRFNTQLGRIGNKGLGSEEKDMFDKLRLAGGKVMYLPELIVYHSIDDSRLTKEYVRNQVTGNGASERIMTRTRGSIPQLRKFIEYMYKNVGGIVLAIWYSLHGQFSKGYYLLFIRWYATIGFLKA